MTAKGETSIRAENHQSSTGRRRLAARTTSIGRHIRTKTTDGLTRSQQAPKYRLDRAVVAVVHPEAAMEGHSLCRTATTDDSVAQKLLGQILPTGSLLQDHLRAGDDAVTSNQALVLLRHLDRL